MRKLLNLKFAGFIAAGVVLAGCGGGGTSNPGATPIGNAPRVRFLHAAQNVSRVDVNVGTTNVTSDLGFGQNPTEPAVVTVGAGNQTVNVIDRNSGQLVFQQNLQFNAGGIYDLIFYGPQARRGLVGIVRDQSTLVFGDVFHAGYDPANPSNPVDVYVTDPEVDIAGATPIRAGLTFGGRAALGNAAIPVLRPYRVRITAANTKTVLADSAVNPVISRFVFTSTEIGGGPYRLVRIPVGEAEVE